MKKTLLLNLSLLVLLTSCNYRYLNSRKILDLEKSEGELISLTYDDFINRLNATSLLILSSSICSYCEMAMELHLSPFVKENKVNLYYFEINDLGEDLKKSFNENLKEKNVYYNGVPYMFIMENGKYINEEEDYNYFIDFIKEYTNY